MPTSRFDRGSRWQRWDPHIHTPGTLFNDQFAGNWDEYLRCIDTADPAVVALGIADYCVPRGYSEFRRRWQAGAAANVQFIFPNIEFRLKVETEKHKGINIHLLFSPDDVDHEAQIHRCLESFTFEFKGTHYRCTPTQLMALGRAFCARPITDEGALRVGAAQFKLDFDQLKKTYRNDDTWMRRNCLIAVCVNSTEGTAGLQADSSFTAMRREIEAFADIIFSARPRDRSFWLGEGDRSRASIEEDYGGLKPCLHGSDAHELARVLRPDADRYCWIRAKPSFSGLRQTLLEPALRAYVGSTPPGGPLPSECIDAVDVVGAQWLENGRIELNQGLVTIIGPKGSGKTALADMIAHAAGAPVVGSSSFLRKAEDCLDKETVRLTWGHGEAGEVHKLRELDRGRLDQPHVRYLSQHFVERLCSSNEEGQHELLDELEAVVFQSVPNEARLGATTFAALRMTRLVEILRLREDLVGEIERLSQEASDEQEKEARLKPEQANLAKLDEAVGKHEVELKKLMPTKNEKVALDLTSTEVLIEARELELQHLELRKTRLGELKEAYESFKRRTEQEFENLQSRFAPCDLSEEEWASFRPTFQGDPAMVVEDAVQRVGKAIRAARGRTDDSPTGDVSNWPLEPLKKRAEDLKKQLATEVTVAKRHLGLVEQIGRLKRQVKTLKATIEDLAGATKRKRAAIDARRGTYARVFETYEREQAVLQELYEPLRLQLASVGEAERRLGFHVQRRVDVDAWASRGEELLDLRRSGDFRGYGSLRKVALQDLAPAWTTGGPDEVAAAMEKFITTYMGDLLVVRREGVDVQDLGRWLFSTTHIVLEYEIRHDDVEISRLSPGMRGIVLLMLYLAIDRWDMRPLVVDQPEENLDPQSVYEQLKDYFRDAKQRRQVILVTHNPNLVVNTDADQVIVAEAVRTSPKGLPRIRYSSGGLEDKAIRDAVCRILEGGERAFLERERRYAIRRDHRIGA